MSLNHMKAMHFKQAPLKDGEDLAIEDRGDEIDENQEAEAAAAAEQEEKLAREIAKRDQKEAQERERAEQEEKEAKDKGKGEKTDEEEEEIEGEDKGKRRDTRIPVARHKEILERERAERARLEAQLAQYQQGEDFAKTNAELAKAENKLIELEGQYAKLITDGKPEDAAKVMGEIRKLDRAINTTTTRLETAAAESRAYERARYDTVVERIEAAYPILNPDHDDFDGERAKKVLRVAFAYQQDGMTPAAALQESVKDLLGDPQNKKQETAVDTTPRVSEADKKKAEREEAARRKAAEAAGRQPPNTKDAGKNSDALGGSLKQVDVFKLKQADFAKLDDAELSRMRGDDGIVD